MDNLVITISNKESYDLFENLIILTKNYIYLEISMEDNISRNTILLKIYI